MNSKESQDLFLNDLRKMYNEDKKRLVFYQQEYKSIKLRLERERVLEALNLINRRVHLELELKQIESQIITLSERKAQYDLLFV